MVPFLASLILVGTLALILTDRLNHTIAAVAGAAVMIGFGISLGFYSEEQALEAIQFKALGLLLGMMIIVAILEPSGFFQYAAIKAGHLSRGNPWRLVLLLGAGTALVSLFFNNITTVVLVGPITIMIAELIAINPIPILMAQALLSDTADVGTSIGDPASVLVASASGYSFTDFLTHAMPIVLVAAFVTLLMLRFLFSKELSKDSGDPELVMKLDAEEALQDPITARRVMIILLIVIILFIVQRPLNISSEVIALCGAAAALVWIRPNVREVLHRVDWAVLLFFVGLFVMVGGLEAAGVFDPIAAALTKLGYANPRLLGVVIIWVVISLLTGLAAAGVNVRALWWAVIFGAGFGGNATSIGSGANILIVSLSKKTHTPITSRLWSRRGLPVAIATCVVGSILFFIFYPWLSR
jgi:Na+/H+ antiporter NhaD/arsenite permease-like protein